ncbi:MAG: DsbA family protein [Thermoproteota archaeon]|nr:DsbA family protein [Thermoproteota archaeon]
MSEAALETANLTLPVSSTRDHIQGPDTAPVTLVEYGDYECPYCGEAYPIIKNIQDYFGNKLCFVFRNFPVTQVHPHAQHAAEAAEAAGAQNKFWEMHDYLYEHQQALEDNHLRQYASSLEMDVSRFDYEMSEHVYADRIREDFMSGIRSGVNGTPTFFINGKRYDHSWDEETLLSAINETLTDSKGRPAKRKKRTRTRTSR